MQAVGGPDMKLIAQSAIYTNNWLSTAKSLFDVIGKLMSKGTVDLVQAGKDAVDEAKKAADKASKDTKDSGKKTKDQTVSLSDAIGNMFATLTDSGGLLDQMDTAFTNIQTQMETQIAQVTVDLNRHGEAIGFQRGPIQLLHSELGQLRDQVTFLLGEKGVIVEALRQAQHALAIAKRVGDRDAEQLAEAQVINLSQRLMTINSTIAQQQQATLDKMEEILNARLQAITDAADKAISGYSPSTGRFGIGIDQRVAQAMGKLGQLPDLASEQLDVLRDERQRLARLLRVARARGDQELARQIESQIADLHGQIVEGVAAMIQAAQDAVDVAASRRQARIDIQNRIADVTERYGDAVGAQQQRRAALVATQANVQQELAGYQSVLAEAISRGMGAGVTDPLKEKIADLIEQLSENAASLYENTIAIRQASIDAIQNRQTFLGGVNTGLSGIVQTLGAISGTLNVGELVALMKQAIDQLTSTGVGLRDQLAAFIGEHGGALPAGAAAVLSNLQNLHGQDFVTALSGIDMNSIITSLGGPASPLAQQFETLIQAIIDNEGALQDNTSQLLQLNAQNQIQQFTSTAWQWFRQAIFTGMGGLLPAYSVGTPFFASAQGGGEMLREGLVHAHRGEIIVPPNWSGMLRSIGLMHSMSALGASGSMPVAGTSVAAARIQSHMAGLMPTTDRARELEELRKMVEAAGDTNVTVNEAEPGTDPTYLANKIAFNRKTPIG
jgi:hypothetical protein